MQITILANNIVILDKKKDTPTLVGSGLISTYEFKTQTYKTAKTPKNNQNVRINTKAYEDAGFYVVKQKISKAKFIPRLLKGATEKQIKYIESINPHLVGSILYPGQIIIFALPFDERKNQIDIAGLQKVVREVEKIRKSFASEDQQTLIDTIEQLLLSGSMRDSLAYASAGLGAYSEMATDHYSTLSKWLKEYEQLHIDHANAQASGSLLGGPNINKQNFYAKRRKLRAKIDLALNQWTRRKLNIPEARNISKSLKLSTKSIIHKAKAANGNLTDIDGFAVRYKMAAKHLIYLKNAGRVAAAIAAVESGLKIYEACDSGTTEDCQKAIASNGAGLIGSTMGGAAAGRATYYVCNTYFSVPTEGTSLLWCAVPAAAASLVVGEGLGRLSEALGEDIYYMFNKHKSAAKDAGEEGLYR